MFELSVFVGFEITPSELIQIFQTKGRVYLNKDPYLFYTEYNDHVYLGKYFPPFLTSDELDLIQQNLISLGIKIFESYAEKNRSFYLFPCTQVPVV